MGSDEVVNGHARSEPVMVTGRVQFGCARALATKEREAGFYITLRTDSIALTGFVPDEEMRKMNEWIGKEIDPENESTEGVVA
jgi:hypothetical protein